jgi:hypothetical protein
MYSIIKNNLFLRFQVWGAGDMLIGTVDSFKEILIDHHMLISQGDFC